MSRNRETRRPIEHIILKVKVEGDVAELRLLQETLARAKVSRGTLLQSTEVDDPLNAIGELRRLGDVMRAVEKKSERL
jgi:hypothetical protein